jgi:hypothetical protein
MAVVVTLCAAGVQCREAGPGESGGGAAAGGTGILSRGGEVTVAVVDTIPSISPLQEHRLSLAFLSTAAARSVRDLHLPCRGTSACEMCFFLLSPTLAGVPPVRCSGCVGAECRGPEGQACTGTHSISLALPLSMHHRRGLRAGGVVVCLLYCPARCLLHSTASMCSTLPFSS